MREKVYPHRGKPKYVTLSLQYSTCFIPRLLQKCVSYTYQGIAAALLLGKGKVLAAFVSPTFWLFCGCGECASEDLNKDLSYLSVSFFFSSVEWHRDKISRPWEETVKYFHSSKVELVWWTRNRIFFKNNSTTRMMLLMIILVFNTT